MRRRSLEPLRERPFRLLWLAAATSAVGDSMTPVALTFAVLDTTDSAAALGLVFAAFTLSHSVFILAGGVWADRLERRVVMLTCDLIRCVALLALAVLVIADRTALWEFVVLAIVVGAAQSFFAPASTGIVPQVVSRRQLQNANALLALTRSGTWIAGPALSGLIVAAAGPGWVFAIDSATFAASAILLAGVRVSSAVAAERRAFFSDLAEGWRVVRARRWLWASLVSFGIGNMAWGAQGVLGPIVAEDELGGAAAWGAIVTAGGIGGAVGGIVALRWRPSRPLLASHLVVLGMAGYLLLFALSPSTMVLALGAFAAFVSIIVANTLWETVLQSEVPPDVLSRVSSYDWAISLVFMPIGFALWGPISELVGVDTAFVAAALVSAAAKVGPVAVREVRDLRRADAAPPRARQATT
jgi:MFS family permease